MESKQIEPILDGLATRLLDTDRLVDAKFPLFRELNKAWVTSSRGSWLAGFWSGSLWLAGYATASKALMERGQQRWQRLAEGSRTDSVFRAMNAWYGFGPAQRLSNDRQAESFLKIFQSQLAQTFSPDQFFPLGTAMGGGNSGQSRVCIDPGAALIELSRDAGWEKQIQAHNRTTIQQLMTEDGDFYTHSRYQNGWHSEGVAGAWPRGQSWGVLAMATAALEQPDEYSELALRCSERWWQRYAARVPVIEVSDGRPESILSDPSAALICAVAFFKLNEALGGGTDWHTRAIRILTSVLNDSSMKPEPEPEGIVFVGCCYAITAETQAMVEMPYGYFFLLQSLLIATGKVSARQL